MIEDKSRLIVRKASAGAGKTFTLVKEYIKLAFSGESERDLDHQFAHILAITFTNKAANEMKVRIMDYLDEIASKGEQSPMAQAIHADTGLHYGLMSRYAERVKRAILHNYSDLSVCTIDSFMHRIVKTFAHDLDLPMNFDVLLDNDDLIQTSVDDLMALAGQQEEEELTKMLCEFAEDRMEEGKSFKIEDQISELAKQLFTEGTAEQLSQYEGLTPANFGEIQKKLRHENRLLEQQLKSKGEEGLMAIREAGVSAADLYQGARGIAGYFDKTAKGQIARGNSYAEAFAKGDNLAAGKASKEAKAAIETAAPILQGIYAEINDLLDKGLALYNSRTLMLKNIYSIAVLNRLDQIVKSESHDNDMVHISEFNKRISEVIQEEPMPFIYERVGSRYTYVLIDEFQDTSKQQWRNLMPLVSNAVSDHHTCLIVGDGKQAIYRFRKGDVEQFVRLPEVEEIHDHGRVFGYPGVADVGNISENWRTRERIVTFNNEFYKWAVRNAYPHNEEIQAIYWGNDPEHADLEQLPQKDGGFVQVGFVDVAKQGNEAMWDALLADIRHQVDDLHYRYSDITILGRDNKVLSSISQYLSTNPDGRGLVPMVSSESFLLKNSTIVMLIRATLRYLLDTRDRLAATQMLVLLQEVGRTRHDYTADLLRKDNDYLVDMHEILAHDQIDFDVEKLRALTLYDCCEEIVRSLGLQGMDTAYTTSLFNVVAAYSRNHRQDLAEFLEWFDSKIDSLSSNSAGAENAVRLMTIHKSKGLESKIIIYAILPPRQKPNPMWVEIDDTELELKTCLVTPKKDTPTVFDDQIEKEQRMQEMDDLNVLYVATTRPRSKLLIYSAMPSESASTPTYPSMLHGFTHLGDYSPKGISWTSVEKNGHEMLQLGEDTYYEDKEEKQPDGESMDQITYPDWTSRMRIARLADRVFDTTMMERIQEGVTLHEIFAKMRNKNEAEQAIAEYAQEEGLDEAKVKEISTQIKKLMQQEGFAKFFDPQYGCLNECDMIIDYQDEEDGSWKRGPKRPDRVVLAGDETWVVDFKTGSHSPKHHRQVENYCNAFRQLGYPGVKGYLLYIHKGSCRVEAVEQGR